MKSAITFVIGFIIATALQPRPQAQTPVKPDASPVVPAAKVCPVFSNACKCECPAGGPCTCVVFPSWDDAGPDCWAKRKNCIVFAGTKPRKVDGFEVMAVDSFCDGASCKTNAVIVGVWHGQYFTRHDLPGTATDADIRSKLTPAHAAGSSRPAVSVTAPAGFQNQVFCRGGR